MGTDIVTSDDNDSRVWKSRYAELSGRYDQLQSSIRAAFVAGYHCQWLMKAQTYTFDPKLSPGDPDGAFKAWLAQDDPPAVQCHRLREAGR